MNIKNGSNLSTDNRGKSDKPHRQLLNINNINFGAEDIAHQNSGSSNGKDQNKRKIIVHK